MAAHELIAVRVRRILFRQASLGEVPWLIEVGKLEDTHLVSNYFDSSCIFQ
jgi:hypothetical protein